MFEVDLSTAFFIYLTITLMGILCAWIYFEYRKKAKRFNPLEKIIFRCRICAHSYVVSKDESFSKCPQCGSIHDIERKS